MDPRATPTRRNPWGALAFALVATQAVAASAGSASATPAPSEIQKSFDAVCERARPTVVTVVGLRGHANLRVDSEGTSEIALGERGAERLLGRGHLIAKLEGESDVIYAQVPFASPEFIEEVVEHLAARWPTSARDLRNWGLATAANDAVEPLGLLDS